jgi:hypothetical protein
VDGSHHHDVRHQAFGKEEQEVNVLTFSVMLAVIISVSFWFLNDVLPQILFQRKLDKTAKAAEECRKAYEAARASEETAQLRMPDWSTEQFVKSRGWVE